MNEDNKADDKAVQGKEDKITPAMMDNQSVTDQKPKSQKKKSHKVLYWGIAIPVIVAVIAVIGVAAFRLYKSDATDSFTVKVATLLPFPAATVDGSTIYYKDVKALADTIDHYYNYQAEQNPDNTLYEVPDYNETFSDTLDILIDSLFIKKQAQSRGLSVTQEEADNEMDDLAAEAELYGEDIEDTLKTQYNWTKEEFVKYVIIPQLWEEKLLEEITLDESIEENKEAKENSLAVYNEIMDGEISFAEAAAEYSDDSATADVGGELGLADPSVYVEEFKNALVDLEVDEVSEPVHTSYGWHIIKLLGTEEQDDGSVQYNAAHILFFTIDFDVWLAEQMEDADISKLV
jgi:parvulin-like peptidyl-prolyl isomerase